MSTAEKQPQSISERLRGLHADIVFNTPVNLWAYLETLNGHTTLYDSQSLQFEYPIETTNLYYFRDAADDIKLTATIDIDATVATYATDASWQATLSNKLSHHLENDLESTIYRLPHQERDFYVGIDDTYAARIEFDTETHVCHIVISLEKLHQIEFVLGNSADEEPESPEPSDHYEVLKAVSRIWSLVIDTAIEEFGIEDGDGTDKPQIVISTPVDFELSATKPGKRVFVPGVTIPEVEMRTAEGDQFDLIGGLTQAKERLEDIASTFLDAEGAAMYGIKGRHFLLHGPAGTGKTSLVKAFANLIHADLLPVNTTDLVDMWTGNSGKHVVAFFNTLKTVKGPVVVFFDEFDALASKGHMTSNERIDVKRSLNTAIDDITANHPNVIIAAATNSAPDDLEPSLVRSRRLEPIAAGYPNEAERVDVWAAVLARSFLEFSSRQHLAFDDQGTEISPIFLPYEDDIDPKVLATRTEGMTGADFETILEKARRRCYKTYQATGEQVRVSQMHILREIENLGR